MNPIILARASKVVPDTQLLVNIVRLRVRQLSLGHRPLITAQPGMGVADIALSEIADHKISSTSSVETASAATPTPIINFPAAVPKTQAA